MPRAHVTAVVGVGASAGGLQACSELLAHLPQEAGLAVLIVQHQEPSRPSQLAHLLGLVCPLPVLEASDHLLIEPDHVYVLPPGMVMELKGLEILLRPHHSRRPIDQFFMSLAEEQQRRAVGVVLSGTGSDGTSGLEAIKAVGGVTFAQDEASSRWAGMPANAVTAGAVDACLPPPEIAAELGRLATHPYLQSEDPDSEAPSLESEGLARLLAQVRKVTGVDFTKYKPTTIGRRIQRRMMLLRIESIVQYEQRVRQDPHEADVLYQDLLITVTELFRDPAVYEFLASSVIPQLLAERQRGEPLRIWVPGCSKGDEVYSLAILLLEGLQEEATDQPLQFFGTDINERAIERARAGWFPEIVREQISPERLKRFFHPANGGYQIKRSVRDLCTFARQDLTSDPPFSRLDLISCRNVLIYLSAPWQERVLRVFHYALKPHGRLILGASESLGRARELFTEVDKRLRVYAKRQISIPLEPELSVPRFHERPAALPGHAAVAQHASTSGLSDLQREADRVTLARYAPAGVIVNEHLDVVQFRGRTGLYLEPPPGNVTHNLLNLAREGLLADLRTAVQEARAGARPVRRSGLRVKTNGHYEEVDLEVIPLHCSSQRERHLLVLFQPAGHEPTTPPSVPPEALPAELQRLQGELAATRDYLISVTQQYDSASEDLKAAYEEIQSANEELQSTNEELETAKEELQSTNEELTTLNEELCERNLELVRANNDLGNLLSSVNIPVMILGSDMRIRRFTSVAERFLSIIPSDVGRRLGDLRSSNEVPDLEERIQQVIETLQPQELEVQDRTGHWFSLRIRPYRTTENQIDGALVAFVDVDPLKRSLDSERAGRELSLAVLDAVAQPLLVLDPEVRVLQANRAFYKTFQTEAAQTVGQTLYALGEGRWDTPALRKLIKLAQSSAEPQQASVKLDVLGARRRSLVASARPVAPQADGTFRLVLCLEVPETGKT